MHASSRQSAIECIQAYHEGGGFLRDLSSLVSFKTESQRPESRSELYDYLEACMTPKFNKIGFECTVFDNPIAAGGPILVAQRLEDASLPTVLIYGHGDVIVGQDDQWSEGLSPWDIVVREGRMYGRGTADNKGQHLIAMEALRTIIAERGGLGFNCKFLIEMSEEIGSPGLREFCNAHADLL